MTYKGPQHEIIGFGADDLHEKVTTPTNEFVGIYGLSTDGV